MSRWMDKMGLITAGFALGGLSLGFLMTWLLGPSTFDGLPALLLERVRGETPQARVARIRVQFLDQDGLPVVTIFDVLHRDGAYWGAAAGHPPRQWALYDVYPRGEEPLSWRYTYSPGIEWLNY